MDIQNSSLTLSMDVKLAATRSRYSVLFSDIITTPGNAGAVAHSWLVWAKTDGTVEFMNYNLNGNSSWFRYWNLGSLPAGSWANITLVFDNVSKSLTPYINGVKGTVYGYANDTIMAPVNTTTIPGQEAAYWTGFNIGRAGDGQQDNMDLLIELTAKEL